MQNGWTVWTGSLPDNEKWKGWKNIMFEKEMVYFNFRIIDIGNGIQVIDESVKTPMDALTTEMQLEYMEVNEQLDFMKWIQEKERKKEARKRKSARNPLYRMAFLCGLV